MSSMKLNEYDILIGRLTNVLSDLHYATKYSFDRNTTFELRGLADELSVVIEGIKKEKLRVMLEDK